MNAKLITLLAGLLTASPSATQAGTRPEVTVIAELEHPPGNPAVGIDSEVYLSLHPFGAPKYKVVRLDENGVLSPFPSEAISAGFLNVIGVTVSEDGIVWILDMGGPGQSPKLLGWSPAANRLEAVHYIPDEAVGANPFLQDLAVDSKGRRAYLADMSRGDLVGVSEPAIVVIDLDTGQTRRVLNGHDMFQPEPDAIQRADGEPMVYTRSDGSSERFALGLNPIGIDERGAFVYFSTIAPGSVYRVPTTVLGDFESSDEDIVAATESVGMKKTSDGLVVAGSSVYLTNVEDGSIDVLENGSRRTLVTDERFRWPDGLAFTPDGALVATISQLHRTPAFNDGVASERPPYLVVRIDGVSNQRSSVPATRTVGAIPPRQYGSVSVTDAVSDLPNTSDKPLEHVHLVNNGAVGIRVFRIYSPVRRHQHRYSDTYLHILSGRAVFAIEDNEPFAAGAGDLLFWQQGTDHQVIRVIEGPLVVYAVDTPTRRLDDVHFASPSKD